MACGLRGFHERSGLQYLMRIMENVIGFLQPNPWPATDPFWSGLRGLKMLKVVSNNRMIKSDNSGGLQGNNRKFPFLKC